MPPWGWSPAFQSTLPVWGATLCLHFLIKPINISIHAPRVGSDETLEGGVSNKNNFKPRSPCGERRAGDGTRVLYNGRFQSTLPVWGATRHCSCSGAGICNFNPRSPCGERQQRYTNFRVHLWRKGRIFASLREERRDSHQAAALRDRLYGENRGANLPAFSVYYGFAVRESRCPPANSCSCSQNAPPSFRTGCPDSKTAASPFQHP